ncbi:MAG: ATP-binding protein [Acidobacteria bacterium]|nr:ATP-binding protein [Acidobacteriota bacterium]
MTPGRIGALIPALLLAGLGVWSFLNRTTSLHGDDGVLWANLGKDLEAVAIQEGSPGALAGIKRGDQLITLAAVAPSTTRSVRELLWGRAGLPTRYQVLREGQRLDVEVLPRPDAEENRLYYFLFIVGSSALAAGSLALMKLPFEPASPALYGLCLAFFSVLALSPGGNAHSLDWILYWGDLAGRLLLPPLFIYFVLKLSEPGPALGAGLKRGYWLFAPAILLLAVAVYLIPVKGALAFADPAQAIRLKDQLELFYLGGYTLLAISVLHAKLWGCTRASTRWRLKWVAASAAAGLLPLCLLYLLPVALGVPAGTLGELSVLPLAIGPLGFTATLFQERAVDLDRSLRAAVRWAVTGAVFLSGGAACSWLLSLAAGRLAAEGILAEVVFPLSISGALAIVFYRFLGRKVDRLLGRRPARTSRLLLELGEDLNGEVRLEPLAKKLVSRLESRFGVHPVLLLVEGPGTGIFLPAQGPVRLPHQPTHWSFSDKEVRELSSKEMVLLVEDAEFPSAAREEARKAGLRYAFPLVVRGHLRALLLTGSRRDRSTLEGEDLDAMAAVASQAAKAVEAARLYREIEERRRREKHLRRQTDAILQSSRVGILLCDAAGKITAANLAAARILGHPAPVGTGVEETLPKELLMLLDRSRRDVRRAGAGERVLRFSLGWADGKDRVINASRFSLGTDPWSGMVYTLDDVSEEVRREESMVRHDHLAELGLLASQVAHEVNTPLAGIASYAQLLMARMKSRIPEMELLKKIESQAFRAAGIAGSVLNFARRKDEEPKEEIDPGAVMAESLALFEPQLKGKRIRLSTERAPSLPMIRGHRGKIQQVILNLLMNAAQALPSGGEIRLALDRDGESVRIRVSDSGVGIPATSLPRIFEPFFTARWDGKGTGLGLSVVQRIVLEHGGTIQVESVEGAGSTFTVSLPSIQILVGEVARGA